MTIGQVAKRSGLAPSAIRYYEARGLLPAPARVSGRRVYDGSVLRRLAVIGLARNAGFRMAEIRTLLAGFERATPPSARWRKLATSKLDEVEGLLEDAERMRRLLQMLLLCECPSLEDCASFFEAGAAAGQLR